MKTKKNIEDKSFRHIKTVICGKDNRAVKAKRHKKTDGGHHNELKIHTSQYLHVFSDIEGYFPENLKTLFQNSDKEKNKDVIAFTGDLIDRGECSIENLKYMINYKLILKDRLILICGNRDLNKIRLRKELALSKEFKPLKI